MLYGEPRVTHDIDFVVFLRADDALRLMKVFPGPQFYVPPAAVILEEMARERRGHFNLVHVESGLKGDFYTAGRMTFMPGLFAMPAVIPLAKTPSVSPRRNMSSCGSLNIIAKAAPINTCVTFGRCLPCPLNC